MRLAEATAWRVYEEYREAGQDTYAHALARTSTSPTAASPGS
jgi:hypothetical protein